MQAGGRCPAAGTRTYRPSTSTAVLLAVDDLDALEETIAVLSDAATMRALGEADAELARGEGENADSLAEAMRARRATA